MKKVVLSVVAALAVSAVPALAADMPVKAMKAPAAAPSMWDVAFGTAFTNDYVLRGISQSDRRPAVQGYFEGQLKPNDMITLYAGVWGSSLWTGAANAEFDVSGGARLSIGQFGLDVGYVHYFYPGGTPNAFFDYGEVYAKPSFKFNDWLTVGAVVYYAPDINQSGTNATYYAGNATITLPVTLPYGIAVSLSGEVGRQVFDTAFGTDYTVWNAGVAFNYKAITLDLRYWDTDISPVLVNGNGTNISDGTFVATLKFDTTLSALK